MYLPPADSGDQLATNRWGLTTVICKSNGVAPQLIMHHYEHYENTVVVKIEIDTFEVENLWINFLKENISLKFILHPEITQNSTCCD